MQQPIISILGKLITPKFVVPSSIISFVLMNLFFIVLDITMTNFNSDREVLTGLCQTFQRMVLYVRTRVIIDQQLKKFKGAKCFFEMHMTIDTRNKEHPVMKLLS